MEWDAHLTPTTRAERAPLFSFYTLHLLKGNLEIKVEAGSHERRLMLILPHLESDRTLKIIRKSLVSSLNRKYTHTVRTTEGSFLLLALEVLWSERWCKFLKFWWPIRLLYFVCSGSCEAQSWGKSVPGLSSTFSPCPGVESWYGPSPHAPGAPWEEVGQLRKGSHRYAQTSETLSLLSYEWENCYRILLWKVLSDLLFKMCIVYGEIFFILPCLANAKLPL